MKREYGSGLPALVDNPMTPRLAMEIYTATAEALDRWEPRIRLTRVNITKAEVGRVTISLEGMYQEQAVELTDIEVT
jgi:phage baseplate assembly protein W